MNRRVVPVQSPDCMTGAGALQCRLSPKNYSSFYRPTLSEALFSNGEEIRFPSHALEDLAASKTGFILRAGFHRHQALQFATVASDRHLQQRVCGAKHSESLRR